MSRMNPKLLLNCRRHSPNFSHIVYPLCSFFSNSNGTIIDGTHINYPLNSEHIFTDIVGSCDGILCLTQSKYLIGNFIEPALWNPSTRKYKLLPYLDETLLDDDYEFLEDYGHGKTVYGFGYDHLIDKYKVVAVSMYICCRSYTIYKTQVKVHTSDTNSWRLIQDFPSVIFSPSQLQSGIFVNGTINWLVLDPNDSNTLMPIVSLDLGTESYDEILQPDYGAEMLALKMRVSRDCLCILARHVHHMVSDIWLMKEYGNRESWTKLISVPDMRYNDNLFYVNKVLHISEDDQVLLEASTIKSELVVYDLINSIVMFPEIEIFNDFMLPEIYIESLISPCS